MYKTSIGLEIHARIPTKTKLFSRSLVDSSADSNENVTFFDVAVPGTLPLLNEEAVNIAIKTALMLNCQVNKYSRFDRKHYFYPDLPLGFQISQFFYPIANYGFLEIKGKKIEIERIHMETDSGKLVHDFDSSYIDYNRVGCGLMEIVTGPNMSSGEEAAAFAKELILHLEYANQRIFRLEEGDLRFDINVSVSKTDVLGQRVEIKNLNSIKFMIEAIAAESARQIEILESGGSVKQQTRSFDSDLKQTNFLRSKENESDYRYVPDYNLPPIVLDDSKIENIKSRMFLSPSVMRKEWSHLGESAEVLISDWKLLDYFFETIKNTKNHKNAANLIASDLMGICKQGGILPYTSKVSTLFVANICELLRVDEISMKIAKIILQKSFDTGEDPKEIVIKENLGKISDENIIKDFIKTVSEKNPKEWERFINGENKLLMFILGEVLKLSGGRAAPEIVKSLLLI